MAKIVTEVERDVAGILAVVKVVVRLTDVVWSVEVVVGLVKVVREVEEEMVVDDETSVEAPMN